MNIVRRTLSLVGAFVAAFVFAQHASAQSWPQRNITMIVSQSAGASPDVMARLLADQLSKTLGVGVIVENRPGGANVTGSVAAARAEPDGYTLFFATSAALVTNPFLVKGLPYDPIKSFTPIAFVARSDQLLVVHPDVPAKTFAQLVELDKKEPGKISIGVDSPRSLAGVTAQAINRKAGTNLVLVPYPNIGAALQDVMTGRIQSAVLSTSIVESHIREGKMRALAVATAKRSSVFPDVPAIAESYPGFDLTGWFMLVAPAGTPAAVVSRINAETATAVKDPKLRETAAKLGFSFDVGSPEAAGKVLKQQLDLWEQITKELGLEPL
jgi:tripartite-type tricarboxylate transporter receptor subunit TctC